jgi:hypothetical protein
VAAGSCGMKCRGGKCEVEFSVAGNCRRYKLEVGREDT